MIQRLILMLLCLSNISLGFAMQSPEQPRNSTAINEFLPLQNRKYVIDSKEPHEKMRLLAAVDLTIHDGWKFFRPVYAFSDKKNVSTYKVISHDGRAFISENYDDSKHGPLFFIPWDKDCVRLAGGDSSSFWVWDANFPLDIYDPQADVSLSGMPFARMSQFIGNETKKSVSFVDPLTSNQPSDVQNTGKPNINGDKKGSYNENKTPHNVTKINKDPNANLRKNIIFGAMALAVAGTVVCGSMWWWLLQHDKEKFGKNN